MKKFWERQDHRDKRPSYYLTLSLEQFENYHNVENITQKTYSEHPCRQRERKENHRNSEPKQLFQRRKGNLIYFVPLHWRLRNERKLRMMIKSLINQYRHYYKFNQLNWISWFVKILWWLGNNAKYLKPFITLAQLSDDSSIAHT